MKKYLLWLGLSLFLGFASCSDNSVVNNSGSLSKDTTEHKKIPVYLGNRAMFVSYDPIAMSYKGQTSGYTFPLISWRLLGTDPAGIAFDVYKCESGKTEMKLNKVPITDATCYVDSSTLNATVSNTYRVTLAGSDSTVCSYTFLCGDCGTNKY